MYPNNCLYLKKGLYNYSILSFLEKNREIYQIDDFNNNDIDKIKVFSKPGFNSKVYEKNLCPEHEKWKRELMNSKWFSRSNITDKIDPIEEKKDVDNTFGLIYNIMDGDNIVFKFSTGNVYEYDTIKDIDYNNNNVLWIKISKEYYSWMPFIKLEI